jgi:hypothetical protein
MAGEGIHAIAITRLMRRFRLIRLSVAKHRRPLPGLAPHVGPLLSAHPRELAVKLPR